MNKNTYYIYQCVSIRDDGSKIERFFKMPSFWSFETLMVALVTTGDSPGLITTTSIKSDYVKMNFLMGRMEWLSGYSFDANENSQIEVIINYNDGSKLIYNCTKIGIDVVEKRITRKTPIMLSATGFSRYSHNQYVSLNAQNPFFHDSYSKGEELHLGFIKTDITKLFTLFLSDFFQDEDHYK